MAEPTPEELKAEEEVTRGLLRFVIDGGPRFVPELKWRANEAWQDRHESVFVGLAGLDSDTPEGQRAMAVAERELVLAYDVTGALGNLEDATATEIDAAYLRLLEVSYPLTQRRTALMMTIVRRAVESALANSTSSPSPTGTSPATPETPSRSGRSISSGARRRNASPESSGSA